MIRTRVIQFVGTMLVPLFLLVACERDKPSYPVKQQTVFDGTIVAVGDSLTAGLGVSEDDAYPARLEKKLRSAGYSWRVINAGNSGETSSGTLSRVDWILKLKPDIVILETGANDGLRGIDPRVTRKNIDAVLDLLKRNNIVVVLAGMRMVPNLGREFTAAFGTIYPDLARKYGLILVPFFLKDVAGEMSLNQSDGMHPTSEGYRIITDTVYPYIVEAIKKKK
jgi:acyl-CoA thioesterase-1